MGDPGERLRRAKVPSLRAKRKSREFPDGTHLEPDYAGFMTGDVMTVLAHAVVLLGLLTALGAFLRYLQSAGRGSGQKSAGFLARAMAPRQLVKIHLVVVALASLILLTQLLSHDFSNGYVFSYSDRSLPLHYLLSSFYAGQQGSFLFWALCAAVLAVSLLPYLQRRRIEHQVMAPLMGIQSFLLLLILLKSPFESVWSMFPQMPAGSMPADGRGLNPLLQNFWMVIHPPVLFLGFAAMALPYAFAIGGLWRKQFGLLVESALPWVLFAVASLGLGIMLGGYWAYGVLGWGGYWGWDPVENSSLVPWLIGMALLHTLLAQLRTGKFVRTNTILAIASFVLVIYSTFLTRSGILGDASVHSFTDPGTVVYGALLAFLGVAALTGVVLLAARWKEMRPAAAGKEILTREVALGSGTLALVLSALVVLFGTSLPIFSTTRVEPSFYDATNLPIAIAIGLLIGISLYLQWERQDVRSTLRRAWKALVASAAVTGVLLALGVRDVLMAALAFASVFTLAVNLDVAVTVARGNWRFLGGKVAHIGVALFFLGVLGSGRYSTTEHAVLPVNAPQEVLGHRMTYTGARALPDGKFAFEVRLERDGGTRTLSPVMFETREQGIMKNPDIASFWTYDLYFSPVALEGEGEARPEALTLRKGVASVLGDAAVTLMGFEMTAHGQGVPTDGMPVGAVLKIVRGSEEETITPVTLFRPNSQPQPRPADSRLLNGRVSLMTLNVGMEGGGSAVTVAVEKQGGGGGEALVAEVSVKPFISLVWGGTVLILVGFALSIVNRSKES
jgi:cytochrome c-type biogenesis protein CcmF